METTWRRERCNIMGGGFIMAQMVNCKDYVPDWGEQTQRTPEKPYEDEGDSVDNEKEEEDGLCET